MSDMNTDALDDMSAEEMVHLLAVKALSGVTADLCNSMTQIIIYAHYRSPAEIGPLQALVAEDIKGWIGSINEAELSTRPIEGKPDLIPGQLFAMNLLHDLTLFVRDRAEHHLLKGELSQ